MKKNQKIIIIFGAIIVIALIILLIINQKKEQKILNENINHIKSSYEELNTNVKSYNQIRSELTDKLSNFLLVTYQEEANDYTKLLTDYNSIMKSIDKNIIDIDNRCNIIYKDIDINKICANYQLIYEKLVNLYVGDLNNYNAKVTSYNEYKKEDNQVFEMIHKEYIDYNNDSTYEGRSNTNEEEN